MKALIVILGILKLSFHEIMLSFRVLGRDLALVEFGVIFLALASSMKVPVAIVALYLLARKAGRQVQGATALGAFGLGVLMWYDWTQGAAVPFGALAAAAFGVVGLALFWLLGVLYGRDAAD